MLTNKVEIWQVNISQLGEYNKIPMLIHIKSILEPTKINGGLGGIIFNEIPVSEYVKDLGKLDNSPAVIKKFDTTNWAFFIAYVDKIAVGGVIVAARTKNLDLLDGRNDLTLLWDLRVRDRYQRKGIGTKLWNRAKQWGKENGYTQMKIESQNNNVRACNFYARHGAVITKFDENAYSKNKDLKDEIQLIWHINL